MAILSLLIAVTVFHSLFSSIDSQYSSLCQLTNDNPKVEEATLFGDKLFVVVTTSFRNKIFRLNQLIYDSRRGQIDFTSAEEVKGTPDWVNELKLMFTVKELTADPNSGKTKLIAMRYHNVCEWHSS